MDSYIYSEAYTNLHTGDIMKYLFTRTDWPRELKFVYIRFSTDR